MFSSDSNVIDFTSFAATPDLPPQNIEAEEAILGGILQDPGAIDRVIDFLAPKAFYINAHTAIYESAIALHSQGKPTDLIQMAAYLSDHNLLDKIGGKSKLVQLVERTVTSLNIDSLAALVMDKYTRRCLLTGASNIERVAHDGTKTLEQVKDEAEHTIYSITQIGKQTELNQVEAIADVCPRLWQQLEQGKTKGISTGFLDLDAMTGGFYPETLTIAAGRTSMGKTQLAIALTYEVARIGLPVVFFTCEMSKEEIANRLLARISMIDSNRLREGRVETEEWEPLADSTDKLAALPVYIHSAPRPRISEMRSVLRRVSKNQKPALVILDYIQLLGDSADNRVNELDKVVRDFRALAKEFCVPCFGLAQINRGVEQRTNKRPLLSDIRESGAIENHADVVMLLYRDEYYNPSSVDRGIIEIDVAKNRHGQTGVARMLFSPQYSLFRNLARGKQP